jgi:hypothetical protein
MMLINKEPQKLSYIPKSKTVSGRELSHLFFLLSQQYSTLSRILQSSKGEELEEAITAGSRQ